MAKLHSESNGVLPFPLDFTSLKGFYTMRGGFLVVLLGFLGSSCGKYYLSVQQQWVDISYLASAQANTPDPRKEHPPLGQMLIIDWRVPKYILRQDPRVLIDLIYWDYTTKTVCIPIKGRMDYTTYKLFNEEYEKTGGILTYKARIVTQGDKIFKESRHQLWVNLINIEEDESIKSIQRAEEKQAESE